MGHADQNNLTQRRKCEASRSEETGMRFHFAPWRLCVSFVSIFGVLLLAPSAAGPRPRLHQGALHQDRVQIPMRDGVRLFTAVYTPKDASQQVSDPDDAHAVRRRPYGADQYPKTLGPSPLFGKEGYIFVYQDIRGRWMSEGTFVDMRPHNPAQGAEGRRRKQRHLRHDRLAAQERRQPQRQGRPLRHVVSRLARGGRDDRRASRR